MMGARLEGEVPEYQPVDLGLAPPGLPLPHPPMPERTRAAYGRAAARRINPKSPGCRKRQLPQLIMAASDTKSGSVHMIASARRQPRSLTSAEIASKSKMAVGTLPREVWDRPFQNG